eukprot:jgi/Ulvmu1/2379/UM130_0012.1
MYVSYAAPRLAHSKRFSGFYYACKGICSQRNIAMESMSSAVSAKVAVAQMTSINSKAANLARCSKLIQSAREQGCSMVFLPECFAYIGTSSEDSLSESEPLNGPTMQSYCELARTHSIWLSLGGFHEKAEEAGFMHNSHVIVDSGGSIVTCYKKINLFDVDIPNGPVLMESRHTRRGTQMMTCDSPVGRLGLSTCYDLRFPQFYQRLVIEGGAAVLLVPSAFTKPTGEAHWMPLLRARAIENQAYVIAAAQAGRHSAARESYGHAVIIDPWGRVVAELDDPLATGIATADIDLAELQRVRTKMPVQAHRAAALPLVTGSIEHTPLAAAGGAAAEAPDAA